MSFPAQTPQASHTEALVEQHLALVGHVVRETLNRLPAHVAREDLMSAGMVALVQAAQAFDPTRGTGFAGYAVTRIRGALLDELRGMDWASRSVRRRARRVDEVRDRLAVTLGRAATTAEVAEALGVGVDELHAHADDVSRASVLSLQGLEDGSMEDLLPSHGVTPAQVLEQREQIAYLHDAVELLPARLRVVVEDYFFAEKPMAEIAEKLGVTESRVSQLRAEAVRLLRGALHASLDPHLAESHDRPEGCAARRKEAYYASVAAHRTFSSRLDAPAPVESHTA